MFSSLGMMDVSIQLFFILQNKCSFLSHVMAVYGFVLKAYSENDVKIQHFKCEMQCY